MGQKRSRYVIAYDIPSDKRRNKVARALEGHGERVQYSVFECRLTAAQFQRLWEELSTLIDDQQDSIRAYRLCAACAQWFRTLGPAIVVDEVPDVYIV